MNVRRWMVVSRATRSLLPFLLALAPAAAAAGGDEAPWYDAWFDAGTERIRTAAAEIAVDPEHSVQVLFEEGRYDLAADGSATYRFRLAFRVDSPQAIDGWSRVSRAWRPWYQERPVVEGMVIPAGGEPVRLDPAHLGEYSEGEDGPSVYGDTMRLRGPLPAVGVGSIVLEQHVVRDHRPLFDPGMVRSFSFGHSVPVHRSRFVVRAPETLALRHRTYRLEEATTVLERAGGHQELRVDVGPLSPRESDARLAPGDVARGPLARFSTGESWSAIAGRYSEIVDELVAGAKLEREVRRLVRKERDRDRVMALLLEHLHETVRYTGVEFGERSLIPATPGEVLERRFGDCKDKATLLVAMLRAAGIDAHVALLNTGPSHDVDPALPGMGLFDHAIVRVAGEAPVWIDATARFARAGELPSGDEDRLALVAAPDTTELERTPATTSADNTRREVREVYLARDGAGRVVETTETRGSFDLSFRSSFGEKDETGVREQLERYVEAQYHAETLGAVELSEATELATPMTLRLEAEDCKKAWTTASEASAPVNVAATLTHLPDVLKPDDETDDGEEPEPRHFPVAFPSPYTVTLEYRIHPPPGFAVGSLPEGGIHRFGPAELAEVYETPDDGTVRAVVTFDTGPRVYSAEQTREFKQALGEYYKEDLPRVVFHQVGEAHLQAGRIHEALDEFRALAERLPEDASFRTRIARACLQAGLGREARREARRATELDPDSAPAHRWLGIVLAHDELGRKFVRGFDLEGAERALREAKRLDPDDGIARGELAILLEHDAGGERYGRHARLDEAIAEYEALREELEIEGLTTNLMAVLLRTEAFERLRQLWKGAPRDTARDALYLAAVAVLDGVDAAKTEATRVAGAGDTETYRATLLGAADWLAAARRYPEAAALMSAGARGASDSVARLSLAAQLSRTRRSDPGELPLDTPGGAARALFVALVDEELAPAEVADMLAPAAFEAADREALQQQLDAAGEEVRWIMRQSGLSDERLMDGFLSLAAETVAGDPATGYRVTVQMPGSSEVAPPMAVYVVPEGEPGPVAGFGRQLVGAVLLDWLDEGHLDRVRTWLDWLAEDLAGRGDDPLAFAPLVELWKRDGPRDAGRARVAAASLMTVKLYGDRVASILLDGLDDPALEDDAETRVALDLALVEAVRDGEGLETQLAAARRLIAARPRSSIAVQAEADALRRMGRFEEAAAAAERAVERIKDDPFMRALWAESASVRGDLTAYRERMATLIDQGRATPGIYNNLAWLDLIENRVDERTLELALQAVTMTEFSDPASLHTVATIYAEIGQVVEARDVLLALLTNRTAGELDGPDWYVLGRIAEHYGARDTAADAYRRVEAPGQSWQEATSTHLLATRRLAGLEDASED